MCRTWPSLSTSRSRREWPFALMFLFLVNFFFLCSTHLHWSEDRGGRRLQSESIFEKESTSILYTVTSLAEYNTKGRSTIRDNSDRLQQTIIPALAEGVKSMLSFGYRVDVVFIAGYNLLPQRKQLIRDSLPDQVKLEFWEDAIPLGYDAGSFTEGGDTKSRVGDRTVSLARQHRFVVKDKFLEYDLFVNFEDDMLIKGDHVMHYLEVSEEIEELKRSAVDGDVPELKPGTDKKRFYTGRFHGNLTKGQLNRIIPGFIRAEVLLSEDNAGSSNSFRSFPVPIDNESKSKLDPSPCCHVSKEFASKARPAAPSSSQIIFWETSIMALGIRQMPLSSDLGWVAMLRGPKSVGEPNTMLGDYWSGADGYFSGNRRPAADSRNFINNQGGWMGTRQQIWTWHTEVCQGSFLPPFDVGHFRFDGLDLRDVEWWSGGLHLVTLRHACNMQRIVTLEGFDRHLIYHTANNKQSSKGLNHFSRASDLLGQLRTVQKNAERSIQGQD
mmetsp:Transcript_10751/g.15819  ORF Transcript_10751/g.15819 Transcript_10751/m.15819 type:complete len:498 (-) Transcript_10751:127-1620(-)